MMRLLLLFSLPLWFCSVSGLKSPSKLWMPIKSMMKTASTGVASIGVAAVVMTGGPDISIGVESWRSDLPSSVQQSFTSSSSSSSSTSLLSTIIPVSLPISLAAAVNPSSSIAPSVTSDPSASLTSPSSASKLEADVFSSLP